jgi:hypothetical protein
LNVLLAVLREEDTEATLFQKWLHLFRLDLLDLPVVDGRVVPGLIFPIVLFHLALRLHRFDCFAICLCC